MLFRLFMFGLLVVLAFRLVKALLRTILTRLILHNSGDTKRVRKKNRPRTWTRPGLRMQNFGTSSPETIPSVP